MWEILFKHTIPSKGKTTEQLTNDDYGNFAYGTSTANTIPMETNMCHNLNSFWWKTMESTKSYDFVCVSTRKSQKLSSSTFHSQALILFALLNVSRVTNVKRLAELFCDHSFDLI